MRTETTEKSGKIYLERRIVIDVSYTYAVAAAAAGASLRRERYDE